MSNTSTYSSYISNKDGWNIRDYHHLNERLCNGVSFSLNTVLIILLIKTKNQFMKTYSRVLLQNCIIDLIYTLTCALGDIQIEVNEGVVIFIVNGFVREWPLFWHYAFIWLYMTTASMTLLIVNIEFFFRYMLICKSIPLTTCQLILLALILYTLSGLAGSFLILALLDTPDQVATFGHLMRDPIWYDVYGKQTIFAGATRTNVYSLLFTSCAGINNVLTCGVIYWLGIATFRTLRQSRHTMSANTKALNTQMNIILMLQASFVLFIINVPVGCLISALLLDINIVGFGTIMSMILVWIPMSNPSVHIAEQFLAGRGDSGEKELCRSPNMNHREILGTILTAIRE
ncbi:serpentine type 7TM GPCR chemoreceptor srd domain-containing protein [Ditylenchus destructor]|uniref:Serpentine type 7TM GPCR chemoreceptor srd domain-containing protein n=1 Tax=Ditylenchus destructor TaxID=166010 RepID=A0AAD4MIL7_9BILA|nr:serpentine type 7TM GPCR chemoreceptor srd domain-containing protein [Ditylenchus destructor]